MGAALSEDCIGFTAVFMLELFLREGSEGWEVKWMLISSVLSMIVRIMKARGWWQSCKKKVGMAAEKVIPEAVGAVADAEVGNQQPGPARQQSAPPYQQAPLQMQSQRPVQIQCGKCRQIFGAPTSGVTVICLHCGAHNQVP